MCRAGWAVHELPLRYGTLSSVMTRLAEEKEKLDFLEKCFVGVEKRDSAPKKKPPGVCPGVGAFQFVNYRLRRLATQAAQGHADRSDAEESPRARSGQRCLRVSHPSVCDCLFWNFS